MLSNNSPIYFRNRQLMKYDRSMKKRKLFYIKSYFGYLEEMKMYKTSLSSTQDFRQRNLTLY